MQIGDAIGDSAADAVSVSDTIDGDRSRASETRGLGDPRPGEHRHGGLDAQ